MASASRPQAAPADKRLTPDEQHAIQRNVSKWVSRARAEPELHFQGLSASMFTQSKDESLRSASTAMLEAANSNASHLQIHSLKASTLPPAIGHLRPLEHLELKSTLCTALPLSLAKLANLSKLELHGNILLERLPENIRALKALTTLDIRTSPSLKSLPMGISALPLDTLILMGTGIKNLPTGFVGLSHSLQTLNISHPPYPHKENGLQKLPDNIGQFQSLKTLTLRGQEALTELPASLGDLSKLETLNLAHCTQLKSLPDLSKLSKLKTLDLSSSGLLNSPPKLLAQSLAQLPADCTIIGLNATQRKELDALRPRSAASGSEPRFPQDSAALAHQEQKLAGWTTQLKSFKRESGAAAFTQWLGMMARRTGHGPTDLDKIDSVVQAAKASPGFRARLFDFAKANMEVPRQEPGTRHASPPTISPFTDVNDAYNVLIAHQMSDPHQMNADQAYAALQQVATKQKPIRRVLRELASSSAKHGAAGLQHTRIPPMLLAYVQTHDDEGKALMEGKLNLERTPLGTAAEKAAREEVLQTHAGLLRSRCAAIAKELLVANQFIPVPLARSTHPPR